MTAFAFAMDRIFADPNMAVDAMWLAGGAAPGIPVRVIRKAPDRETTYGGARVWSETMQADVRVSEVPNPGRGDRIVIDGEVYEVQGEPMRDRERLVWTLDLRPA